MPSKKVTIKRMKLIRAKKKIEASATITNTMMVVMVVSRRVGPGDLGGLERTSCRNFERAESHRDVIRV